MSKIFSTGPADPVHSIRSCLTLSNEIDYIRAIDYSPEIGLVSITDNGHARLYDLKADSLTHFISTPNQTQSKKGKPYIDLHGSEQAIPTCLSMGRQGLVVIGFTDEKLKLYDVRCRGGEDAEIELESD